MENKLFIPFPAEHLQQSDGDLERYLKNFDSEGLIRYENIPNSLTAKGIEIYANWFSDLTKVDPLHHERGELIHAKKSTRQLIFPSSPDTGLDSCGFTLMHPKEQYVPVINVHSHPSSACFSGEFGDLGTFMEGWGEGEDYVDFPASLVSTQRHNFLLLKSSETPAVNRFDLGKTIGSIFLDDVITMRKKIMQMYNDQYGSLFPWSKVEPRLQSYFGQSVDEYFLRLHQTFKLSELYKAGFYFSTKDGNYIRFTSDSLQDYIEMEIQEALNQLGNPNSITLPQFSP